MVAAAMANCAEGNSWVGPGVKRRPLRIIGKKSRGSRIDAQKRQGPVERGQSGRIAEMSVAPQTMPLTMILFASSGINLRRWACSSRQTSIPYNLSHGDQ